MSEFNQAGSDIPHASTSAGTQGAWFRNWMREGAEKAAETFGPPEAAAEHFREARLEILRGIREFIDHRIARLSKDKPKGSRIVVE